MVAQSMEVQKTIHSMKKELGLEPFGDLKPYSRTECPPQVSHALNKREKTSLDINAALLEETCLFNLGLMNGERSYPSLILTGNVWLKIQIQLSEHTKKEIGK